MKFGLDSFHCMYNVTNLLTLPKHLGLYPVFGGIRVFSLFVVSSVLFLFVIVQCLMLNVVCVSGLSFLIDLRFSLQFILSQSHFLSKYKRLNTEIEVDEDFGPGINTFSKFRNTIGIIYTPQIRKKKKCLKICF